ncbi:hypothetical protein IJI99_01110 [bacterium]|nr:hypothetical protein [bacterium]
MSPDQVMPVILIIVMVVVAVVLVMVVVQLFLLLRDARRTIRSVNALVDNGNEKLDLLINPIRTLGSLASGVAGGFKAFEAFSKWLKTHPRHDS